MDGRICSQMRINFIKQYEIGTTQTTLITTVAAAITAIGFIGDIQYEIGTTQTALSITVAAGITAIRCITAIGFIDHKLH